MVLSSCSHARHRTPLGPAGSCCGSASGRSRSYSRTNFSCPARGGTNEGGCGARARGCQRLCGFTGALCDERRTAGQQAVVESCCHVAKCRCDQTPTPPPKRRMGGRGIIHARRGENAKRAAMAHSMRCANAYPRRTSCRELVHGLGEARAPHDVTVLELVQLVACARVPYPSGEVR
jgi:hypothetical protein